MGVRMQAVILVAILHIFLIIVQQCHCSDNESDEEESLNEALLLLKILRTGTTPESKSVAELISAFKASSLPPQDRLIQPRPPENVSLVLDAFGQPSDTQPLAAPKENFRRNMRSNHDINEIHKESRPLRRAAEIDYYESVPPDELPSMTKDYDVLRRKMRRRHRLPFYRREYYDYYVHTQAPHRRLDYEYPLGSDTFRSTSKDLPTTVTSNPTLTGKASTSKTTTSTSQRTTVAAKPKSVSKKRIAASTANTGEKSVPIKIVAKGKSTPSPKVLAFHRQRNYKKPSSYHPNRRALEDTQPENATIEVTDGSTTAANTDITSTIMEQMTAKGNQEAGQDPILSQVQTEIEQEMKGMQKTKHYFEMKLSSSQTTEYYPSTLRVHLARSTRYPIPLPENHAFCFLSPDNGLCRSGLG